MKIRIELDEKLKEDEVLIRTSRLTDEIAEIQKTIVQTGLRPYNGVNYN